MITTTTGNTHLEQFQALRIEALENEIERLNLELEKGQVVVSHTKTTDESFLKLLKDEAFYKPLSELNIEYGYDLPTRKQL